MKPNLLRLLTTATLLGAANFASAQTFLTDKFTVTANVELQPNFEIGNRQTGTGSAFAGNGSRVVVLNNGIQLLDYNFGGSNLSSGGLRAGWAGELGAVAGLDNLSITAVPEPSSVGVVMAGGLALVLIARRGHRTA